MVTDDDFTLTLTLFTSAALVLDRKQTWTWVEHVLNSPASIRAEIHNVIMLKVTDNALIMILLILLLFLLQRLLCWIASRRGRGSSMF